jgi:hypothetical protein
MWLLAAVALAVLLPQMELREQIHLLDHLLLVAAAVGAALLVLRE